jgi:hypothetical protein
VNAFQLEKAMDELFEDESELTPKEAAAIGAFRAVLWARQAKEKQAEEKAQREWLNR